MNFEELDVFQRLAYGIKNLSQQQKKICVFINKDYKKATFMTIEQISKELNVGSATIMRTVHNLGYSSYKELTNALKDMFIQNESTYWQVLRKSWEMGEDFSSANSLLEITHQNVLALQNSISELLSESFDKSISELKHARKIAILGLRSSYSPSYYLFFLLNQFIDNVFLVDCIDSMEVYSSILKLGKEDVFFVFSLGGPNYAARTHEAIKFAKSRGVKIILVSDSLQNPSYPVADIVLLIPCPPLHYSMVPVMNLLDALIAKMGVLKDHKYMKDLEKALTENGILL
jgi:DNA-binding MurR/RpiR family transcriptional regulator